MRAHKVLQATAKVQCRNTSMLGYAKWEARKGDWITWQGEKDGEQGAGQPTWSGRVLGIVVPNQDGLEWQGERVLEVATFNSTCTGLMIRWVHPDAVICVEPVSEYMMEMYRFLVSPELAQTDTERLEEWVQSGYASVADQDVARRRSHEDWSAKELVTAKLTGNVSDLV